MGVVSKVEHASRGDMRWKREVNEKDQSSMNINKQPAHLHICTPGGLPDRRHSCPPIDRVSSRREKICG
ncbi:hypothetical protein NEOLEDRAFT_1139598 [Neolentinus lepideus HHB14362 ss-1]|uniref:Uncharacterized protein n=1 Tax=Neolentinus lepideus HHB14362 ss-1 TaxID=1314782 RepID=A0A165PNE5_9AGAM|nr:hypothetical protein NEOLEDRAFT_1139598 [Neolentinus lepideus HHB14362 ss-1]